VRRLFLRFEENLAALCLGGLLLTLFLQVFTRFITRDPLSWTEEAARYLYVSRSARAPATGRFQVRAA
jgi:TRAP-type C4-dicarboxylate transport system permease small subunit